MPDQESLDEETIDRIMRRAAELANQDTGVDAESLVAAAVEAGIPPDSIRLSVALDRLGPTPEARRLDRVVGVGVVVVERTIGLAADDLFERLDEWLTRGHHLRRIQREGLVGEWRKRADIAAKVQRRARSLGGGAGLGSARIIQAQVSPVDEDRAIVRVEVDRTRGRKTSLGVAGGVSGSTVVGGALAASSATPLGAVVVPGIVAVGVAGGLSKRAARHVDLELTHLLDALAAGRRPTKVITRRS